MRSDFADIRTIPGYWYPWGHGSVGSQQREAGYLFPCCGKALRKPAYVLIYADGDEACNDCARAWCESQEQVWKPLIKPRATPEPVIAQLSFDAA